MVNRSTYPNQNQFREGHHPTTHRLTSTQRSGERCRDADRDVQEIGIGGLAIREGCADPSTPPEVVGNIKGYMIDEVARALNPDPRRRL